MKILRPSTDFDISYTGILHFFMIANEESLGKFVKFHMCIELSTTVDIIQMLKDSFNDKEIVFEPWLKPYAWFMEFENGICLSYGP